MRGEISYQKKAAIASIDPPGKRPIYRGGAALAWGYLWSSYHVEADVLYVNFKKPSQATDSELTDDGWPNTPS